jgi:NMD protein affecting ribosome stability and mRNA decay
VWSNSEAGTACPHLPNTPRGNVKQNCPFHHLISANAVSSFAVWLCGKCTEVNPGGRWMTCGHLCEHCAACADQADCRDVAKELHELTCSGSVCWRTVQFATLKKVEMVQHVFAAVLCDALLT